VFHASRTRASCCLLELQDREAARASATRSTRSSRSTVRGRLRRHGRRQEVPPNGMDRARRYAKHEGGKKSKPREKEDPESSCGAGLPREWRMAAEDEGYLRLKESTGGERVSALTYTVTTANSKRGERAQPLMVASRSYGPTRPSAQQGFYVPLQLLAGPTRPARASSSANDRAVRANRMGDPSAARRVRYWAPSHR
jgi:hypothetical protein